MTAPLTDADLAAARALAESVRAFCPICMTQVDVDECYCCLTCGNGAGRTSSIATALDVPRLCDALEEARRESLVNYQDSVHEFDAKAAALRRAEAAERERDEARARVETLEAAVRSCPWMHANLCSDLSGWAFAVESFTDRLRAAIAPTPILAPAPCATCGGDGRIFAHGPGFDGRMEPCPACAPEVPRAE